VSITQRAEPAIEATQAAVLRAAMALPERVQRALLRRPVVIDGLELAPDLQMMLRLQKLNREPALGMLPTPEDSRAVLRRQLRIMGGRQPIGAVRDLSVDGAEGSLPARLYTPTRRLGQTSVPTMLFIHGGGMALGDVDCYDAACRHLAEHSGVQLLSVEYRLAPSTRSRRRSTTASRRTAGWWRTPLTSTPTRTASRWAATPRVASSRRRRRSWRPRRGCRWRSSC
jgi:acetyl esterase